MAKEARVMHLYKDLHRLGMASAVDALKWMVGEMNAKNGYMRKDGSHYYYHLVDATQDLINHGVKDSVTITACILHDAVEDVPEITFDMIRDKYGKDVAHVVALVTKRDDVDYKIKVNLESYLNAILTDVRATLVKLADRKHNFSTLESTSAKHEERQMLETEASFIPMAKEARRRYPEYSAYFHSFKTTIMPHLKRIKKAIEQEAKWKAKVERLELLLEQEKKRFKALDKKYRAGETDIKKSVRKASNMMGDTWDGMPRKKDNK